MKEYNITTDKLKSLCPTLCAGDKVILSGTVYTARDAAHKRIFEALENGLPLPFNIKNAVIYYAGPTPTPDGLAIGSCGPTTSSRMDSFTPRLLDMELCATIGKGERSKEAVDAIVRNKSVYLCAIGGAGALLARCIRKSELIAWEDLQSEALRRLWVEKMPLVVVIDSQGNDLYEQGRAAYLASR